MVNYVEEYDRYGGREERYLSSLRNGVDYVENMTGMVTEKKDIFQYALVFLVRIVVLLFYVQTIPCSHRSNYIFKSLYAIKTKWRT